MASKPAKTNGASSEKLPAVKRTRSGIRILGRSPVTGHNVLESAVKGKASFTLEEGRAFVREFYARDKR